MRLWGACGARRLIPILPAADRPADRSQDPEDDPDDQQDDADRVEHWHTEEDAQQQEDDAQDDHGCSIRSAETFRRARDTQRRRSPITIEQRIASARGASRPTWRGAATHRAAMATLRDGKAGA